MCNGRTSVTPWREPAETTLPRPRGRHCGTKVPQMKQLSGKWPAARTKPIRSGPESVMSRPQEGQVVPYSPSMPLGGSTSRTSSRNQIRSCPVRAAQRFEPTVARNFRSAMETCADFARDLIGDWSEHDLQRVAAGTDDTLGA